MNHNIKLQCLVDKYLDPRCLRTIKYRLPSNLALAVTNYKHCLANKNIDKFLNSVSI